MGVWEHNN